MCTKQGKLCACLREEKAGISTGHGSTSVVIARLARTDQHTLALALAFAIQRKYKFMAAFILVGRCPGTLYIVHVYPFDSSLLLLFHCIAHRSHTAFTASHDRP